MYMGRGHGLLRTGHLRVGEKALLRQMKPVFVFTLCLPEGNMSKEAQHSEPLRH